MMECIFPNTLFSIARNKTQADFLAKIQHICFLFQAIQVFGFYTQISSNDRNLILLIPEW